jgi:amino acid adenylation domain-containing protein
MGGIKMEKLFYHNTSAAGSNVAINTVTGWLNQGFDRYKTSTALYFEEESLSYDELDQQSDRIASYLAKQGIDKGDHVGICLERSTEMIASILGILKSGAAYVPLDPNYPVDRLDIMREDARLSLLMAHKKYADRFETNTGQVVFWEDISNKLSRFSASPPAVDIDGEDIAYVIFTSGSTGRPKGIEMPHRALSNLIDWQLERGYFKKEVKVLQYSSISFDVSFQEIATTIASGGTLFLINDDERRDPRILLKILSDLEIERLFIPFVALRSLVEVAIMTDKIPDSLKEVITAGEQLRVDSGLRQFFTQLPDSVLENQYGPSETHVVSAHLLDRDPSTWPDLPPIGKPIKNTGIYILDESLEPVKKGETGELYLAGQNLAHGYIGRKELTDNVFIQNPLDIPNQPILYKTGDLGFYNKDGDIEFLGRADHQIKIRGYRVEPGEINIAGAKYPGIAQCITHEVHDQGSHPQLVTYYVPQKPGEIDKEEFKAHLDELLPDYMMPAFVMEIDDIPYTPSGKLNLKSLPKPDKQISGAKGNVTYESETEARLAEIWHELLGFQSISRSADFFDLGGDSLNAVTLFMKIEEQFDKYLPLSTLTQASTIEDLSKIIDGSNKEIDFRRFRSLQVIQPGNPDKVPLFLVHGGAGNVLMFKDLAKGLSEDQPIYAFQWSGWDGNKGEDDILEMARSYKKELREAYPVGPYRLGGHCIGGIVAIEMAKLLKEEGAEILDPILVSDAPNLYSQYYHADEPESVSTDKVAFKRMVSNLESKIPENPERKVPQRKNVQKDDYSIRRFPNLAKYFPFYVQLGKIFFKVADKVQLLRIFVLTKFSIKIPIQDRFRYSTISQKTAIKKYEKTIYEGDILYLKSEVVYGRTMGLQGWWNDIYFGFRELCSGQFDAYVIGGEHNDVLKNRHAHKLIRKRMFGNDD